MGKPRNLIVEERDVVVGLPTKCSTSSTKCSTSLEIKKLALKMLSNDTMFAAVALSKDANDIEYCRGKVANVWLAARRYVEMCDEFVNEYCKESQENICDDKCDHCGIRKICTWVCCIYPGKWFCCEKCANEYRERMLYSNSEKTLAEETIAKKELCDDVKEEKIKVSPVVNEFNKFNIELKENGCSKCGARYPKDSQQGAVKHEIDLTEIFCSVDCAILFCSSGLFN